MLPSLVSLPDAHTSLLASITTASRCVSAEPGLGVVAVVQAEPSQCCATDWAEVQPASAQERPTAHASLAERASTPRRSVRAEPGLGLVTTLQAEPSQCSMSDCEVGQPLSVQDSPTAHTS